MTTYRLASDPMVHMPGIIAWAINGYHFEKDRPQLAKVIEAACPDLPTEHIHGHERACHPEQLSIFCRAASDLAAQRARSHECAGAVRRCCRPA